MQPEVEIPRQRQTYTVIEAANILGISKNSAYEAVRAGQIPAVRIGGKILVPKIALERLLLHDGMTQTT